MVKKSRFSYLIVVILGCGFWGGLAPAAQAQTATVRGFVTDASNGEALQSVNVVVEDDAGVPYGAATNNDGLYVVAGLTPGRYLLRVSFIGFHTYRDTLQLAPREVRALDVALVVSEEKLDEIFVEAEEEGQAANLTGGLQTIQPFDIEQVPSPDLSGDFASYLTTLPGVVVIGDQGGQFYIRGGEPSQNLVLLDGMLVYQPFHVLSFFSAFPSNILNSVDLYAGGFGARYGGRLSSVIDASSRNGNNQHFAGSASISPFIVGAHVEGPIDEKGRLSILVSGRQSVVEEGLDGLQTAGEIGGLGLIHRVSYLSRYASVGSARSPGARRGAGGFGGKTGRDLRRGRGGGPGRQSHRRFANHPALRHRTGAQP